MVAPPAVVTAVNKVKRAFDVSSAAQEAALASLDDARARSPAGAALNAEAREPARGDLSRPPASSPPGPRSRTSSTSTTGADAAPALRGAARRGRDRPPAARLRRADGDPGHLRARRTRTRSSPTRSPACAPASRRANVAPCVPAILARQRDVLRASPSFRLLFASTLISGLGTWIAVDRAQRRRLGPDAAPAVWVSALLIADFLPAVAIGLLLGPLVDRLSRKRLLVGADLVRLAVFVLLAFAVSAGADRRARARRRRRLRLPRPAAYAGLPNLVSEPRRCPARTRCCAPPTS